MVPASMGREELRVHGEEPEGVFEVKNTSVTHVAEHL